MNPDHWEELVIAVSVALVSGLEYHGHELDDVTGDVHALTAEAKKYERGYNAFNEICKEFGRVSGREEMLLERITQLKLQRGELARAVDAKLETYDEYVHPIRSVLDEIRGERFVWKVEDQPLVKVDTL